MLVTNQTTQDIYFGPLHLAAGVGQTLTVDDTSATSLYLLSEAVADALNNAYNAGRITVSGQAQPFPRPTGSPQLLHGDGSPEGLVYAPQGSVYMRRDAGPTFVLYIKTSGVTSSTNWVAIDTTGASVPTGTIATYAAATAPAGWLICDGTAVSRSTYTALFGLIGTTYGSGDGSTTFNVPDLRGRVAVGFAASGGHADVSTLGNNDGVAEQYRRPKHRHTPHSHVGGYNFAMASADGVGLINNGSGGQVAWRGSGLSTQTADGGSGSSSDSLDAPAWYVVNHIIKT